MENVKIMKNGTVITVYKRTNVRVCTAELCKWGNKSMYAEMENTFTLNRLYVPPQYRRQGIATELMNALIDDSDKYGYIIELGVQPDIDTDFTEKQLSNFYKRFGFIETSIPQIMIRYPK